MDEEQAKTSIAEIDQRIADLEKDLYRFKEYIKHLISKRCGWSDNIIEGVEEPPQDNHEYSPLSVADGTVSLALVTALRHLGDLYGPTGVLDTARELAQPEENNG